jgi:cytochrome c-type biogenesis protein CcmH/NrfF
MGALDLGRWYFNCIGWHVLCAAEGSKGITVIAKIHYKKFLPLTLFLILLLFLAQNLKLQQQKLQQPEVQQLVQQPAPVVSMEQSHPVMAVNPAMAVKISQQYETLTKKLRCIVCPNQSLYDSEAPFAKQLKQEIYTMLQQQIAPQEIEAKLIQSYGEVIAYAPAFNFTNLGLWLVPLLLVIGAGLIVWRQLK